ncbi:ATP phosphoribosyltransferase regulatory subunit, partial [Komagataeibacter sp. FXV3]|nr:ATP phosphoribosyltransferase regulatory subunit [Komagataeibacter sp. FXV3]
GGYATVSALGDEVDARAEARRLSCALVVADGRPVPVDDI